MVKMKKMKMMMIKILILILMVFTPLGAWANPFQQSYVCIPPVNPNASSLEFQIREGLDCRDGEQLARVSPQPDGSILLLPAEKPFSAAEQNELDEFKKYYGIEH